MYLTHGLASSPNDDDGDVNADERREFVAAKCKLQQRAKRATRRAWHVASAERPRRARGT